MGAIYGLVGFDDGSALNAMGDRLSHRGPNRLEWRAGEDVWFGCALHREGSPSLREGSVSLACDADIFGYDGLLKELRARGQKFETELPEEIFLRSFLEYGPECFSLLNGYFACAVWDQASHSMLLARDPLAFRPVYYWSDGRRLAFASEYKALLAIEDVPADPDRDNLQHLQSRKTVPLGSSLLKGIRAVLPGSWARFSGGHCTVERYFEIKIDVKRASRDQHADRVREHFLESLRLQTAGTERIGISLSGGIDSTCIAAALRRLKPDEEIHSFTAGSDPDDGDVVMARKLADQLSLTHHEIQVGPELISELAPLVVWHLEDPIARSETLQCFVTAEAAEPHVDVLLGGQIADGLYAGMPKHKIIRLIERIPWLRRPLGEFYGFTQTGYEPRSLLGRLLCKAYFRGSVPPVPTVLGTEGVTPPADFPPGSKDLLNRVLRAGVLEGVPQWLPKVDRLHMASGVQVYSPFIASDVIRNAFEIPGGLKIRRRQEKHILRRALMPLLPPEFVRRRKYPQRMTYDLAFSDCLERVASAVLTPQQVLERGFFSPSDIQRILERRPDQPYSAEHGMRIWTALLTELWARIFLDRRGRKPSKSVLG
jgi:asparagine synthase (glutamine-hydrolysing)